MIREATARTRAPHLFGAVVACLFPLAILASGRAAASYLERRTIHQTAPTDFFIKNQGLAFQRAAARTRDVLLIYGSSELTDPVPNRASDFFASAPSGFQICPVGKAGATSLVLLQKLGGLGHDLRGRKVAISLSPSWFLTPVVNPYAYAGNFSLPQASALLFSDTLDAGLKADIARRMLRFPETLGKSALLQLAARCLASNHPHDRILLTFLWPLGKLQNVIFDLQDHFEAIVYILGKDRTSLLQNSRLGRATKTPGHKRRGAGATEELPSGSASQDAAFRERIATAREWNDLELLLRALSELGARPLILSMPIDSRYHQAKGVSREARQIYYDKMSELAARYCFPLVDFEDHDGDPGFLLSNREHPSPEGWMYYNQALNDFFHKAE